MKAVAELDQVVVGYGSRRRRVALLDAFSAAVGAGEFVVVVGPNGAGKSSLLNTLTGLTRPVSGQVFIDGECLAQTPPQKRARLVAVVTSERPETGLLTVEQLVGFGRHPHTGWGGRMHADDHAAVVYALAAVGADALGGRRVSTLSDGERQRVMVARALAQEPALLVLDEPTAFMDVTRRVELLALVRSLADAGTAIVMSTHDLELALRWCDRVWVVGAGQAVSGTLEEVAESGALTAAFDNMLTYDRATGRIEVGRGIRLRR